MGRIIKPDEIRVQTSSMKQALQEDNEALLGVLPNIEVFCNSEELQGMAWDSVKNHLSNHRSVVQGIICANDDMIADSEALALAAGDEDLIEDDLDRIIGEQNKLVTTCDERIKDYENTISAYSGNMNLGAVGLLHLAYAKVQISHNESLIATAEEIIRELNLKIDKIGEIECSTDSLYQTASDLYANVDAGLRALKISWHGSEFAASSLGWKSALDSRWGQREEINNKNAEAFLLGEGVTRAQIQNMEALGYTPAQVKAGWELTETKEDRKFFKYLMDGTSESYAEAFKMDPNGLSDNMTIVMSGYACQLMQLDSSGAATKKSIGQLTAFNNALLSSETIYYDKLDEGNVLQRQSSLLYRDIYLERLYSGTDLLVREESALLAAMDPNAVGYQERKQGFQKNFGMVNLWAMESLMIKKLKQDGEYEGFKVNISNLSYSWEGNMDFELSHHSPAAEGKMATEKANTYMMLKPSNVDEEWDRQELQRLREAREHLFQKYIGQTVKGAAFLLMSTYAPQLVMPISIGSMAATGTLESIGGVDSYIDSTGGKLAAKGGNMIALNVINYLNEANNMEKSLTEANYKKKMKWFGAGIRYKIGGEVLGKEGSMRGMSISGIYDPDMLRKIRVWEKEGIAGWSGWSKEVVDTMVRQIKSSRDLSKSEKTDCEKLLTGGYEITKEEDMVYFIELIQNIGNAYKISHNNEISLRDMWTTLNNK